MVSMDKRVCAGAVLVAALGLSGCTSLTMGDQYVFPRADEPSATVRVLDDGVTDLKIMNLNPAGCYAGYTPLPAKDGFVQAQVAVGKPLIVDYRREVFGGACRMFFAVTPEAGATYTLKTGSWTQPKTGILPIFTSDQTYCGLGAIKTLGEQQSIEPIEKMRIDTGITCHKFVK
ncbi:hypothetical protein [Pseudomonas sp. GV071]|jgi:hypothetical protein|uniref:hypothetical protein n=1 Tax=Pseudomonas sp. GV071 TaxID=2135754 RepID=UPI000D4405A5|nr:hypothetical protein [Pseudomonas sp. GV071]PTQ70518.1 hypothetical protein C8K61_106244 [Pseudomonas sp. GV071]